MKLVANGLFVAALAASLAGCAVQPGAEGSEDVATDENVDSTSSAVGVAPPAGQVWVESINYAGTGCPAGSVAQSLYSDNTAFSLLFDQYVAQAGPGIAPAYNRRNCSINLKLHVPQGWSFTVATFDYRGFVQTDSRVTATQKSTYYFPGSLSQASAETTFRNEYSGRDYVVRDTLLATNQVWSRCGETRPMTINSQVRVDNSRNRSGGGQLTTDTIEGTFETIYGIQWKRCP